MTLRLESLGVAYGPTVALAAIDLTVPTGTTLAVLGPSGSGKSTLLRAIAGLEPASGRVCWDAEDLTATCGSGSRAAARIGPRPPCAPGSCSPASASSATSTAP